MNLPIGLATVGIECTPISNVVLKAPLDVVQAIEDQHDIVLRFPCYASDGKVLKTAIRANPGLIVLRDGVVLAKYHHTSYPTTKDLETLLK